MRSGGVVVAKLILAVGLLVGVAAVPAQAMVDDREGTPFTDGNSAGYELRGVRGIGETIRGPGLPAWLRACNWDEWTRLEKDAYYSSFTGGNPTREDIEDAGEDPDEIWYVVFCAPSAEAIGVGPQVILTGILETWPGTDAPPQIILDWLIAYGYALVEIPVQFNTTSPVGDTAAPMITQLPTWLWIDPVVWSTRSATTPPVFGVTATVTAEPYRVEFRNSEGGYIDCGANEGAVYNYGLPGGSQSTSCSLTYRDASSVANQEIESTVYWEVTYACSAWCGSGTLPDFEILTSREVRVAEVIGVGVSEGS